MGHDGYEGRCEEAKAVGFSACGENVAYNFPPQMDTTTANTHDRWMNSADHRSNILQTDFDVVGYAWCALNIHAVHALWFCFSLVACRGLCVKCFLAGTRSHARCPVLGLADCAELGCRALNTI